VILTWRSRPAHPRVDGVAPGSDHPADRGADSLNQALAFWGSSDHYEVAARIIKYGDGYYSRICWLHCEQHFQRSQAFILFLNIVNSKRRGRYPCLKKSSLEFLGGDSRVAVWLKKEFNIV
jgi:hypothetical protein